jgi:hypothetical protein
MRPIHAVGLALAAAILPAGPSLAQSCDAYLHSSASDPYGYRARGNRCEGVYIKDLSASLRVVSFTREFDTFTGSDPILHLEWTGGYPGGVHLRANSLRPRLYYEMDSIQTAGSSSYDWETSLLMALRITRPELGIVGWTSQRIGGQDRQVYLPVAVKTSKSDKKSSYQIVIVPGIELRELYVSLSLLDKNGSRVATLRKEEPLKAGYYPAEEGIGISIPELKTPGLYLLELGAEFQRGGVSTETVWFRYGE